jgi:hypothetical protein
MKDEDFENINPGTPRVWLPEGLYPAEWQAYETRFYGAWLEKLIFTWKVFTTSDFKKCVELKRYYNCERDRSKRFIFGDLHDYRKDWIAGNKGRLLMDRNKLPLSLWRSGRFWLFIETVQKDQRGRILHTSSQWSKIGYVFCPFKEGQNFETLPLQLSDFT